MAQRMAARYKTTFVPEVAREIISTNQFTIEDIVRIGRAQMDRIHQKMLMANKVVFCDTDLITTQIYSEIYLKTVPPILRELERGMSYDQYFLFDIDVPWIADGLRDLGSKRQEMFDLFKRNLEQRAIPYLLVSGTFEQREQLIVETVDLMLASYGSIN